MNWLFYLLAFLAGLGLTTQAGVNSQLRQAVANPVLAAIISFVVGMAALLVLAFSTRMPIPSLNTFSQINWWKWTGGLIGACYITGIIVIAPRIGAASMIALIVSAQLISAIVFDHYGWLGFPVHLVNGWRVLGALLIMAGVYLVLRN